LKSTQMFQQVGNNLILLPFRCVKIKFIDWLRRRHRLPVEKKNQIWVENAVFPFANQPQLSGEKLRKKRNKWGPRKLKNRNQSIAGNLHLREIMQIGWRTDNIVLHITVNRQGKWGLSKGNRFEFNVFLWLI